MKSLFVLSFCSISCAVVLFQEHFTTGTYRITQPGRYELGEDISFRPNLIPNNPYDSFWPQPSQLVSNGGTYPDKEYGLGFFAAITIETSDVELDLNGFTLEQSAEHALMQRFFSIVELASSPFIQGQGPHSFVTHYSAANNVVIHNGTFGRSSHHGIHGNGNSEVVIEDLTLVNFEIAAVALNGVAGLHLHNVVISNRKDIPVLGTFSAARFIQKYIDHLVDTGSQTTISIQGQEHSVQSVASDLRTAIDNVYNDVVSDGSIDSQTHPNEFALFANIRGVVDGNSYGILLNKLGVAVNDFPLQPQAPFTFTPAFDIHIDNVQIINMQSMITEIVGLKQHGSIVSDSVGSIVQLLNIIPGTTTPISITSPDHTQAEYFGNSLLNTQMLVAKANFNGDFAGSGLDNSRNKISHAMIEWMEAGGNQADPARKLSTISDEESWQCNGDSMAHVQKGAIGMKIDATVDAFIENVIISGVENLGKDGSNLCGNYEYSHPESIIPYYNGAHSRGMTFAGSKNIYVRNTNVCGIHSHHGNAIGFHILTDSTDVVLDNCFAIIIVSNMENSTGFSLEGTTTYSDIRDWCAQYLYASNGIARNTQEKGGVQNYVENELC